MQDFVVGSLRNQLPAILARSRPEIENAIRRPHDIRIVLYHQNRVSQIPQIVQDLHQPVRIPRMKANRRLIENIQSSNQSRSQRCGQLNALGLSA